MKLSIQLFILLSLGISSISNSQHSFPGSWLGHYQGELSIYGVDSVKMKLKIVLDIEKTANDSVFNWTITYHHRGKKDIRAYQLVVVDRKTGHYQIDELNSIILDGYLSNNRVFTSFFKVMTSYIISTYTKKQDTIVFEIISGNSDPISQSGQTIINGEEIPQVDSYLVNGRQKAILTKF